MSLISAVPASKRAASARRRLRIAMAIAAATAVTGCASIDKVTPSWRSLGVYKIDINQGNYLAQDQIDRLKVGMTPQQVRLTLGTPLIEFPFTPKRWDYVYEYTRQGVVREHRKFTVWFDDDKLARWEGDRMPQTVVDLNRSASAKALPMDEGKSWWQKILDRKSDSSSAH
jgi:outer membrane protein assembly factor BamE (lipoprotein component of BamABCDE complex)